MIIELGILYLLLLRALQPLGNGLWIRRIWSVLLVLAAFWYTRATGASPSLVRAFLFILLNESARLLQRKVPPLQVLCGALTLQLALQPSVITSVGFQLSYLAMAGIVSAWRFCGSSLYFSLISFIFGCSSLILRMLFWLLRESGSRARRTRNVSTTIDQP